MKPYLLYRDVFIGDTTDCSTLFSDASEYLATYHANGDAEIARKHRSSQSKNAKKPRDFKIEDKRRSLATLVAEFAQKPEFREQTASELWPPFFSFREKMDLEPNTMEVFEPITIAG